MTKIEKLNIKTYKNIKLKMEEKNMTQKEIGDKVKVSPTSIWRSLKKLSEGKPVLTDTLFKIAYALEIEVTELLK